MRPGSIGGTTFPVVDSKEELQQWNGEEWATIPTVEDGESKERAKTLKAKKERQSFGEFPRGRR